MSKSKYRFVRAEAEWKARESRISNLIWAFRSLLELRSTFKIKTGRVVFSHHQMESKAAFCVCIFSLLSNYCGRIFSYCISSVCNFYFIVRRWIFSFNTFNRENDCTFEHENMSLVCCMSLSIMLSEIWALACVGFTVKWSDSMWVNSRTWV